MRDFLEETGWHLIAAGLMLLILLVLAALARNDNSDADGFAYLNLIGYVMLFVGFRLLKRVGAWPAPHANRS